MSSWESKEELGVGGWTETLAMGCEERKVSLPVSCRHRDGATIPSPKRVSSSQRKSGCVPKQSSGLGAQEWQLACTVQCTSSVHKWDVLYARPRQEAPAWSPERKQSIQRRRYSGTGGSHILAVSREILPSISTNGTGEPRRNATSPTPPNLPIIAFRPLKALLEPDLWLGSRVKPELRQ